MRKIFTFKRLTVPKKLCYNTKGNDEQVANAEGCGGPYEWLIGNQSGLQKIVKLIVGIAVQ